MDDSLFGSMFEAENEENNQQSSLEHQISRFKKCVESYREAEPDANYEKLVEELLLLDKALLESENKQSDAKDCTIQSFIASYDALRDQLDTKDAREFCAYLQTRSATDGNRETAENPGNIVEIIDRVRSRLKSLAIRRVSEEIYERLVESHLATLTSYTNLPFEDSAENCSTIESFSSIWRDFELLSEESACAYQNAVITMEKVVSKITESKSRLSDVETTLEKTAVSNNNSNVFVPLFQSLQRIVGKQKQQRESDLSQVLVLMRAYRSRGGRLLIAELFSLLEQELTAYLGCSVKMAEILALIDIEYLLHQLESSSFADGRLICSVIEDVMQFLVPEDRSRLNSQLRQSLIDSVSESRSNLSQIGGIERMRDHLKSINNSQASGKQQIGRKRRRLIQVAARRFLRFTTQLRESFGFEDARSFLRKFASTPPRSGVKKQESDSDAALATDYDGLSRSLEVLLCDLPEQSQITASDRDNSIKLLSLIKRLGTLGNDVDDEIPEEKLLKEELSVDDAALESAEEFEEEYESSIAKAECHEVEDSGDLAQPDVKETTVEDWWPRLEIKEPIAVKNMAYRRVSTTETLLLMVKKINVKYVKTTGCVSFVHVCEKVKYCDYLCKKHHQVFIRPPFNPDSETDTDTGTDTVKHSES